ncbi:hypothetical protein HOY80DRAFT_495565 [Tuber brumale]|nr:hypothetical protein HOY80DRAFT_495565 [Tuber brumale]
MLLKRVFLHAPKCLIDFLYYSLIIGVLIIFWNVGRYCYLYSLFSRFCSVVLYVYLSTLSVLRWIEAGDR